MIYTFEGESWAQVQIQMECLTNSDLEALFKNTANFHLALICREHGPDFHSTNYFGLVLKGVITGHTNLATTSQPPEHTRSFPPSLDRRRTADLHAEADGGDYSTVIGSEDKVRFQRVGFFRVAPVQNAWDSESKPFHNDAHFEMNFFDPWTTRTITII
ncbi:hypothetical protein BU16DRAFT_356043 [Lophium mytilinum]|uniref:Uncharacterized protein n=1 Tax=Lophium mytilinum TaxID=390894 RepID=A0A6A6QTM4_9PEZI|nr:hypothetical protein BU16DRAFT_356043 [Lophium mytilinum]